MHPSLKSVFFLRILIDLIIVAGVFVACIFGAMWFSETTFQLGHLIGYGVGLLAIWIVLSEPAHLYDDYRSRALPVEIIAVLKNCFAQAVALVFLLFFSKETILSRGFVSAYFTLLVALMIFEKIIVRDIFRSIRKKGKNLRNLLVVGAGHLGRRFAENVGENLFMGYRVIGFIDDNRNERLNGSYLGPLSDLNLILEKKKIDDIIVALPSSASQKISQCIQAGANYGKRVRILPNFTKQSPLRYYESSIIGGYPVISVGTIPLEQFHLRTFKRTVDLVLSSFVILFVLSWMVPLVFWLQRFSSLGPVFFVQDRIGRNGRTFRCFKFRTMHETHSNNTKFTPTCQDDDRITSLGKILRKTSIDEMPQFINVFLGEMSVVGPRAHPVSFHNEYVQYVEHIRLRNLVKPGITGWAQVNGLRGDSVDKEENKKKIHERVEYDLWYIENWSFWLDIWIIVKTGWRMIKGDPKAY